MAQEDGEKKGLSPGYGKYYDPSKDQFGADEGISTTPPGREQEAELFKALENERKTESADIFERLRNQDIDFAQPLSPGMKSSAELAAQLNPELLKAMIDDGLNVRKNSKILAMSASEGLQGSEPIKMLLAAGAKIEGSWSGTVLSKYIADGDLESVKLLCEHGVIPKATDTLAAYHNVLEARKANLPETMQQESKDIFTELLKYADKSHNQTWDELMNQALNEKDRSNFNAMVESGVSVTKVSPNLLVGARKQEDLEALLEVGRRELGDDRRAFKEWIHTPSTPFDGTPLSESVSMLDGSERDKAIVKRIKTLLEAGANPDHPNEDCRTKLEGFEGDIRSQMNSDIDTIKRNGRKEHKSSELIDKEINKRIDDSQPVFDRIYELKNAFEKARQEHEPKVSSVDFSTLKGMKDIMSSGRVLLANNGTSIGSGKEYNNKDRLEIPHKQRDIGGAEQSSALA